MRLLLLITDLEIGGTPTVVRELALRLRSDKTHVQVACLKANGPIGDQLRVAGVDVTSLAARRATDVFRTMRRLVALIRERQIDVVVSFLVHANVVAALAARRLPGVRFVQSIQTTQPRPRWHWLAQRFASRAAERVVVPTESVARVARERSRVPAEKFIVVPNAIDVTHFRGTSAPLVAELKTLNHEQGAPATWRIGFVGRLDPVKRVDDLVEAVALLRDERVSLDIWGDGSECIWLEAQAAIDVRRSTVTFHGAIADPREAYARIDVLVLPSDAEGFGLVLIEAMASGVPVIGTDVDGIRDVIRHEANGLLVPPRDPSAIAAAITRLAADGELRARLIANGRADVERRFAWPAVLAAYRTVLGIE